MYTRYIIPAAILDFTLYSLCYMPSRNQMIPSPCTHFLHYYSCMVFFVMPVNNLVIDLTFEQSENVSIARFLVMSSLLCEFKQLLLACIEGCGLGNNRFKVHAAFICVCTPY